MAHPAFVVLTALFVSSTLACNKGSPGATGSSGSSETTTGASAAATNANVNADTKAKTYSTRGVIKAFGEGRKSLKIAHEDVPGYMKAMTMPFAVSSANVLDGLKEGDAVEFSFTEESDGRLLIQTIKKR